MPRAARWAMVGILAAAGFAALPEAGLACARPVLRSESPDGRRVLTVCRGFLPFAMPGQGGDAPGLAVLRDARGHIEGAVAIGSLGELGHPPRWEPGIASLPLVAEIPFQPEGRGAAQLWVEDRVWRLRNLLFLLPSSDSFR